jgi:hypothetical protein
MKYLRSWRISNGMDFVFYVKYVMAVIDSKHRSGPSVTLEELDEILDRITIISSFSSIDLRKRIKKNI